MENNIPYYSSNNCTVCRTTLDSFRLTTSDPDYIKVIRTTPRIVFWSEPKMTRSNVNEAYVLREYGRFVPDFVFKTKSGKICMHFKFINMKGCVQNIPIKFKQFAAYLFSNFYRICCIRGIETTLEEEGPSHQLWKQAQNSAYLCLLKHHFQSFWNLNK